MTREKYLQCWRDAKLIFTNSLLRDVRAAAKRIAVEIEQIIGQVSAQPADTWEI